MSAHPAFPLIVGLWFAALFGLGTIVMPAVVLERVTSLTGLTEPPLTAAARATVALLATILGLIGGLALARRVVAGQQVARAPRRRGANPASRHVRPLSVHDDLGEEAIAPNVDGARPTFPGRRRALAVTEEHQPSDFLMTAPLPGADIVETPELPAPDQPAPEQSTEDAMSERPSDFETPIPLEQSSEELDLSNLVADSPIYDPPAAQPPPEAQVFAPAAEIPAPEPYVPELDTRKPRDLPPPPAAEAAFEADELVVEPIDAPLEDLGIVQLAERLGRSMHKRLAAAPLPQPAAPPATDALEFSAPSLDHPEPEEAAVAVPPPVVPDALRPFMDTVPEDLALPPAADEEPLAAPPPPVVPAALQPFAFDAFGGDEDEDLDPGPFTLPLGAMTPRPFDGPAVPAVAEEPVEADFSDEDEESDESVANGSFSSLLAMKNPFRAAAEEFVRVDEPEAEDEAIEPAVVFPGQEPVATAPTQPLEESEDAEEAETEREPVSVPTRPFEGAHQPAPNTTPVRPRQVADPVETERALRSALANLQRMSGAA